MADHYRVLGLDRGASYREIRAKYLSLSKEHHPDRSRASDAEERMKRITAAYQVLSDVKLRREYDEVREQEQDPAEADIAGALRHGADLFSARFKAMLEEWEREYPLRSREVLGPAALAKGLDEVMARARQYRADGTSSPAAPAAASAAPAATFECSQCRAKFRADTELQRHALSTHHPYAEWLRSAAAPHPTSTDASPLALLWNSKLQIAPPATIVAALPGAWGSVEPADWLQLLKCVRSGGSASLELSVVADPAIPESWLALFENPPAATRSPADLEPGQFMHGVSADALARARAEVQAYYRPASLVGWPHLRRRLTTPALPVGAQVALVDPGEWSAATRQVLADVQAPVGVVVAAPAWPERSQCTLCGTEFGFFTRRHHCRSCGASVCHHCSPDYARLPWLGFDLPVRVCRSCRPQILQRFASEWLQTARRLSQLPSGSSQAVGRALQTSLWLCAHQLDPAELDSTALQLARSAPPVTTAALLSCLARPVRGVHAPLAAWLACVEQLLSRRNFASAASLVAQSAALGAVAASQWAATARRWGSAGAADVVYASISLPLSAWLDEADHWRTQGDAQLAWRCAARAVAVAGARASAAADDEARAGRPARALQLLGAMRAPAAAWAAVAAQLLAASGAPDQWPETVPALRWLRVGYTQASGRKPAAWKELAAACAQSGQHWLVGWCWAVYRALEAPARVSPAELLAQWVQCAEQLMRARHMVRAAACLQLAAQACPSAVRTAAAAECVRSGAVQRALFIGLAGGGGESLEQCLDGLVSWALQADLYAVVHQLLRLQVAHNPTRYPTVLAAWRALIGARTHVRHVLTCEGVCATLDRSEPHEVGLRAADRLAALGEPELAQQLLAIVLARHCRSDAQRATVHLRLAELKAAAGDRDQALRALDVAAELGPLPAAAQDLRRRLTPPVAVAVGAADAAASTPSRDLWLYTPYSARDYFQFAVRTVRCLDESDKSNPQHLTAFLTLCRVQLDHLADLPPPDRACLRLARAVRTLQQAGDIREALADLMLAVLDLPDKTQMLQPVAALLSRPAVMSLVVQGLHSELQRPAELLAAAARGESRSLLFASAVPDTAAQYSRRLRSTAALSGLVKFERAVLGQFGEARAHEAALSSLDMLAVALDGNSSCACLLAAARWLWSCQSQPGLALPQQYACARGVLFCVEQALALARHGTPCTLLYVARLGLTLALLALQQGRFALGHDLALVELCASMVVRLAPLFPLVCLPTVQPSDAVYCGAVLRPLLEALLEAHEEVPSPLLPPHLVAYYNFEGVWRGWLPLELPDDDGDDTDDDDDWDEPAEAAAAAAAAAAPSEASAADAQPSLSKQQARELTIYYHELSARWLCMRRMLDARGWSPAQVETLLSWRAVPRTADGWLLPTAHRLEGMTYSSVDGVEINTATGAVRLLVASGSPHRLLNDTDVASVMRGGIGLAFFSLDQPEPLHLAQHPFQAMRFGPSALQGTELLATLFHTDYLLKFFSTGAEVSAQPPFALQPVEANLLCRLPPDLRSAVRAIPQRSTGPSIGTAHRFWIEASTVPYEMTQADDVVTVRFGRVPMLVKKHLLRPDPQTGELVDAPADDSSDDSPEAAFTRDFTAHYDRIGQYFPEFLRLRELTKLMATYRIVSGVVQSLEESIRAGRDKQRQELRGKLREQRQQLPAWPRASDDREVERVLQEQVDANRARIGYRWNSSLESEARRVLRPQVVQALQQADQSALEQIAQQFASLAGVSSYAMTDSVRRWLMYNDDTGVLAALDSGLAAAAQRRIDAVRAELGRCGVALRTDDTGEDTAATATLRPGEGNPCHWVPAAFAKSSDRAGVSRPYMVYGGVALLPNLQAGHVPPAGAEQRVVLPTGTAIYRVWGRVQPGDSGPHGASWSTVDPRTVPNYAERAGLPQRTFAGPRDAGMNTQQYVTRVVLQQPLEVLRRGALALGNRPGGLSEVVIPNAREALAGSQRTTTVQGSHNWMRFFKQ